MTIRYIEIDRMEDVTDPEKMRVNPKIDRSVCLYGYVRGTHFKNHSQVAIPGKHSFVIKNFNVLDKYIVKNHCK